jgi:predicted O-linked N-acetylglucosamine transferase (SPINDLY family)
MHDDYTLMAKTCADHWLEAGKLSDQALCQQIRNHGIQLLMDLAGHTSNHRLGLFSLRAAPVQVTFLGYPHSTGLTCMDWLIGDRWVSPAQHQSLFSEGIAQLPGSVFCWSPVDPYPLPPARSAEGPTVFGSFNNVMKLSPRPLDLWAQVLLAIPNSRLLLKAPSLRDQAVIDRFCMLFAERHVDPARLEFQGPTELGQMMQSYGEIDIALDPFPYNGGTITLQALWMGVPVVSLLGSNFVSRMGASFLHSLGREDWVADDEEGYLAICQSLADQVVTLRQSRQSFRDQMARSPLCDLDRYVMDFQQLLDRMWHLHASGASDRIIACED